MPEVIIDAAGRRALGPVLETARRELRDLDDRDVPHRLRRVAASSARSLPPPLERTLVAVLVDDEAFRARVRERWIADGSDDPLGSSFLEAPGVAIGRLGEISGEALIREGESTIARLEEEQAVLRSELEEAKRRTVRARADADDELARVKAADKAARRGLVRAAREARAAEARMKADAQAARAETMALRSRVAELEAQADRRRARQGAGSGTAGAEAGPATPPAAGASIGGSPPADSLELAIWLDGAERSARPYRDPVVVPPPPTGTAPIGLPPGVAPDRAEAVDAIVRMGLTEVILDGYNIGGIIAPEDFMVRSGRDRVVAIATPLARRSKAAITVVFDAVGVEGRDASTAPLGVSVRFSKDRSADDLIVDMVASRSGNTAVVTNDRDLRERSAEVGAVVVWSDALVEWAGKT